MKIKGRELMFGGVLVNLTGGGTLGRMDQFLTLDEATVVASYVIVRTNAEIYKPYTFARMMLSMEPTEVSTGQTKLSRAIFQANSDAEKLVAEVV